MSVKKIAIVGSGTAGYVGALILKTAIPTIEIDLISSKRIGIIGVGEGTTEHWDVFMKYVGINLTSLIKNTSYSGRNDYDLSNCTIDRDLFLINCSYLISGKYIPPPLNTTNTTA